MKTKFLLLAVVLLTMLSTRAVAQSVENDPNAMRELMKGKLDELQALVPDGVKGLNETLKNNVNERVTNYTNLYNASSIQSYQNYEDAYDELDWFITRVNEYLAAYGEFTVNLAKLKDLIDNFNADTENKQGYKTFAQNVYNAYKALSDYDMIALTDEDLDEQKGYDYDNYWAEPYDVTSENIESVADGAGNHEYISTYGQFNAFFSQNTKELGSIYLEVAGTGTAKSPENLTYQLRNPNFENAGEQWWGTDWTAFGNSLAEQSGKPFITYQQVHLPEGYYTLVGYGMDRRGSWADVLANDEDWNYYHRTYLFSHLDNDGSDSTKVDAFKAKNMALTADITEGAGNISTCEVDGVTYYTPNDMAQYRAWEDAKIAIAGHGHGAVVQFWVWQDEGDFGTLGFAHPWHVDNTWFVADGIQLYYAKDDFPNIDIDTPDCASVTITNTGWATFVSDKALNFQGSPVKAYIVTDHWDDELIMKQMTGTVPANTPLLLNAVKAGKYNIPFAASSSTNVDGNKLVAGNGNSVSAGSEEEERYVLVADGNKAVFKRIESTPATVPVGKAYLQFVGELDAPFLYIGSGQTTGIESIEAAKAAKGVYYNIAGQRVAQPTKGLYIVNGKKVVVK